jgi:hypothetical protein
MGKLRKLASGQVNINPSSPELAKKVGFICMLIISWQIAVKQYHY